MVYRLTSFTLTFRMVKIRRTSACRRDSHIITTGGITMDMKWFDDMEARIPKGKVRTRFAPSPTG